MLLKLVRLQRYRHQDGGFILFVVVAVVLILTSLLATYSLFSRTETSSSKASVSSNTGFYTAEAGLNLRAKTIQEKFVGYNRPQGTSPASWKNCLDSSLPQGSGDFLCTKVTFNNQNLLTYVTENPDNPISIIIGPGEPFAGLSAQEYRYDVSSAAVNIQTLPTAILGMRFKSRLVPLFQFVAFYNNDLDFIVPPNMNLNGPVHTNGNLYLNAANTLTINGQISTAVGLYRGAKDSNSCNGTVNIYNPSTASPLTCSGSTRTTYTQSQVNGWNNRIRVGAEPLAVPPPEALDPTPGQVYWDRADMRLVLKLNASNNPSGIEVRNPNNTVNLVATTNLLNSCPTTSIPLLPEPTTDPTPLVYEETDTVLRVSTAIGFNPGDVVTIGPDYDSNIIAAVNTTSVPQTITLRRQLKHTYQSALPISAGSIVRTSVVSTSDTFYNYREKTAPTTPNMNDGKFIRMLNVDVKRLLDCANSQNLMSSVLNESTDGGLVWFMTVEGPDSNTDVTQSAPFTPPINSNTPNKYGVRFYNGAYLYSDQIGAPEILGLTIISDQAVYVRGDYNRRDDLSTATNEGDNPTTTGVTERKRPAAFLADTINVLSNNWNMDDSYSRTYNASNLPPLPVTPFPAHPTLSPGTTNVNTVTNRVANATTINAAFLAGTDITGGVNGPLGHDQGATKSSGGLNNYPRFHENWAGIPFTYRGSFVSLNKPRRVNARFCGSVTIEARCNIYSPPLRNWDYDTDFNDAAKLPPLTPRFVYLRQEVFSRDFER